MRVLFFMRNFSGYFRQFEPVLQAMLERGHEVVVACDRKDDMRGEEWAHAMQSRFSNLTLIRAPHPRTDPWQDLKRQLRLTLDYLQFLGPEYETSAELVRRARRRAPDRVVRTMERPRSPLRRPRVVKAMTRLLRAVEDAAPSSPAMRKLIQAQRPDIVLLTPHLMPGSHHPDYLRAAIDLGVASVLCVASWDNLSSKQIIRIRPDAVTVWNETQREEAVRIHGLDPERVLVTGAQVYDHWFSWPPSAREAFCARVGLPADRPFVLYVAGALFPAEITEAEWTRNWIQGLRTSRHPQLRETAVLVRPHPKRYEEWAAVDLDAIGLVALWPLEGRMPVDREAKQDFFDSIHHSSGVVGINTSAMIEAGIVGKRVHTVLDPMFAGSQHGTLHFRYLTGVGGGLLHEARDMEEHHDALADTIARGGHDGGANRTFIEAFVRPQGIELASTPRFVDAVEAVAARGAAPRPPRPLHRRILRFAFVPIRIGFTVNGARRNRRSRKRRRAARAAADAPATP